jgi:hypothetical protein
MKAIIELSERFAVAGEDSIPCVTLRVKQEGRESAR